MVRQQPPPVRQTRVCRFGRILPANLRRVEAYPAQIARPRDARGPAMAAQSSGHRVVPSPMQKQTMTPARTTDAEGKANGKWKVKSSKSTVADFQLLTLHFQLRPRRGGARPGRGRLR